MTRRSSARRSAGSRHGRVCGQASSWKKALAGARTGRCSDGFSPGGKWRVVDKMRSVSQPYTAPRGDPPGRDETPRPPSTAFGARGGDDRGSARCVR